MPITNLVRHVALLTTSNLIFPINKFQGWKLLDYLLFWMTGFKLIKLADRTNKQFHHLMTAESDWEEDIEWRRWKHLGPNFPSCRVDGFMVYKKTISITEAEIRQSRVICNLRVDMCVVKPRTALIRASRNKCWLSRNYNRMKTNKQANLTRQEKKISLIMNLNIILKNKIGGGHTIGECNIWRSYWFNLIQYNKLYEGGKQWHWCGWQQNCAWRWY